MKRKHLVYTAALAFVTIFVIVLAKRVYVEELNRRRNKAGYSTFAIIPDPRKNANEFSLKDLEGNRIALGDLQGKVVLINFRTTW